MLLKPILAKCNNRTSMPQSHPTSGTPEEWFSNEILLPFDLYGISFDFFVDWRKNQLTPIIWIKRILNPEFTYTNVVEHLEEAIVKEFGQDFLTRLISFANIYKFQVQFIIFRDDFDWIKETSEILIVTLSTNKDNVFLYSSSIVSIEQFKELIQKYSGGPIQVGTKGLIYGTSRLECYLSGTDSLYPGDVDLVILNIENLPGGIIELKKHTLFTLISDQKLSNYYPTPDGRKYNRLSILKDYLSTGKNQVPFFVVYYPTNASFTEGRLELLKGKTGNLSTRFASNFALPKNNSPEEYSKIVAKLKKAIEYHYSLIK